jgi:hypothetical protein
MLRLIKAEPEWLELRLTVDDDPAVRVQFAPIGIKAVRAARRAVRAAFELDGEDMEEAGDALSRELIRKGILAWDGIGDAEGNVAPVTPENVELFLADVEMFEAADRLYVLPWSRRQSLEKASPPSPAGTGVAETQASDTANSPAKRRRRGAAKNARTSSTSPKAKRAKPSGNS